MRLNCNTACVAPRNAPGHIREGIPGPTQGVWHPRYSPPDRGVVLCDELTLSTIVRWKGRVDVLPRFCHPAGHPQLSGAGAGGAPLGGSGNPPPVFAWARTHDLRGATFRNARPKRQRTYRSCAGGSCAQLHSATTNLSLPLPRLALTGAGFASNRGGLAPQLGEALPPVVTLSRGGWHAGMREADDGAARRRVSASSPFP